MNTVHPALQFLGATILFTISGILYWMAITNLDHLKSKLVLSVALSVILTPIGAWVISLFIKAVHLKEQKAGTSS